MGIPARHYPLKHFLYAGLPVVCKTKIIYFLMSSTFFKCIFWQWCLNNAEQWYIESASLEIGCVWPAYQNPYRIILWPKSVIFLTLFITWKSSNSTSNKFKTREQKTIPYLWSKTPNSTQYLWLKPLKALPFGPMGEQNSSFLANMTEMIT